METTCSRWAVAALALALPLCLGSSCTTTTVRGGGWIPSTAGPPEKATFGFELDCDPETNEASGTLSYNDHGTGDQVFARATAIDASACEDGGTMGSYVGETPEGDLVFVHVAGDQVAIEVSSGYANSGTLRGGHVSFE
jgi:hypothetical protein